MSVGEIGGRNPVPTTALPRKLCLCCVVESGCACGWRYGMPWTQFVFLHDIEIAFVFLVVCYSLLSRASCPVVLTACSVCSFKKSLQLRSWFGGGLLFVTLMEGVMRAYVMRTDSSWTHAARLLPCLAVQQISGFWVQNGVTNSVVCVQAWISSVRKFG